MFDPSLVDGLQAPALKADLSPDDALRRLLSGTTLHPVRVDANTIRVIAAPAPTRAQTTGASESAPGNVRLAYASIRADVPADENPKEEESATPVQHPTGPNRTKQLDEVVITGTHISGLIQSPSPTETYTRDDILDAGVGSLQDFVQKIPENFRGGASEGTVGLVAGGGTANNQVGGTGVNLRGLGNDATLVLLDGHRIAPGNIGANWVDISMIPLGAVEKIDVVPDGASAVYGSDAVAGVFNIVPRHRFNGAETRASYGAVSDGNSKELQAGQTFGHTWDEGSALVSYDYFDRSPLSANDRSYTKSQFSPFTLLPEQVRHAVLANVEHEVIPDWALYADGLYSHRYTLSRQAFGIPGLLAVDTTQPATIDTYTAIMGMRHGISTDAQLDISAAYSGSRTDVSNVQSVNQLPGSYIQNQHANSAIWSLDPQVTGALWELPAGRVRFAVGAQHRRETFDNSDHLSPNQSFANSRSVSAGFAEFNIPLIGPDHQGAAPRLELTLADRYEHYSDFGGTNNPRAGIIVRPTEDFLIRATGGKSFTAPLLSNLDPAPSQVVAEPEFDPKTGGITNALVLFGGNPNLKAQTAETWTVGLDVHPHYIPSLELKATYYNVHFHNRIIDIQSAGVDVFDALRLEGVLGPTVIQRNPPLSTVQQLAATPVYTDYGAGINPSTIGAIVDSRSLNLSTVNTSGIDFALSYRWGFSRGTMDVGMEGTRILRFTDQFVPNSQALSILNSPYNPVDLKLRGHATGALGPLTAAAYINYVGSYVDNRRGANTPIASWTTEDLNVAYHLGSDGGVGLGPLVLRLSVLNVTNADPPFVKSGSALFSSVKFDGANANVLGRFYSMQITKQW